MQFLIFFMVNIIKSKFLTCSRHIEINIVKIFKIQVFLVKHDSDWLKLVFKGFELLEVYWVFAMTVKYNIFVVCTFKS